MQSACFEISSIGKKLEDKRTCFQSISLCNEHQPISHRSTFVNVYSRSSWQDEVAVVFLRVGHVGGSLKIDFFLTSFIYIIAKVYFGVIYVTTPWIAILKVTTATMPTIDTFKCKNHGFFWENLNYLINFSFSFFRYVHKYLSDFFLHLATKFYRKKPLNYFIATKKNLEQRFKHFPGKLETAESIHSTLRMNAKKITPKLGKFSGEGFNSTSTECASFYCFLFLGKWFHKVFSEQCINEERLHQLRYFSIKIDDFWSRKNSSTKAFHFFCQSVFAFAVCSSSRELKSNELEISFLSVRRSCLAEAMPRKAR